MPSSGRQKKQTGAVQWRMLKCLRQSSSARLSIIVDATSSRTMREKEAPSMISALVGHLVGDYLIQNDWMALNKKKSSPVCAVHCVLWATSVCLFAGWPVWTWCVLFLTHYIQDRTDVIRWWMKTVGQEQFASGPCAPWSIIVVDNVWHIVALWAVWKFV